MSDRRYSTEFYSPAEASPKYVTDGQASLLAILTIGTMFGLIFLNDKAQKDHKRLEKRVDALEQRIKDFE